MIRHSCFARRIVIILSRNSVRAVRPVCIKHSTGILALQAELLSFCPAIQRARCGQYASSIPPPFLLCGTNCYHSVPQQGARKNPFKISRQGMLGFLYCGAPDPTDKANDKKKALNNKKAPTARRIAQSGNFRSFSGSPMSSVSSRTDPSAGSGCDFS